MSKVLVIGSNRGIGLELCRQLVERGDTVVAACRKPSDALKALSVEVRTDVDVTSDEALKRLADSFEPNSIDVLVVMSGVLERVTLDALDIDSIQRQFEVNAVGPLRAVAALRSRLARPAKVGLVTSRMGSVEDNTSGSSYGYRMSKAALNMAGRSLAHDLRDEGVSVVLLHPGFVRTDMTFGHGMIDPPEAASGLIARLDELGPQTSGTFLHQNGDTLPW